MFPLFSRENPDTELEGLSYLSDKASFFAVGYTVLMCSSFWVGITGNGLVIYILIFRWCARSSFTYYTTGLATYQLVKCTLLLPALIFIRWTAQDYSDYTSQWLCKGYQACIIFCTLCTSFIKVITAHDRLRQLSRPWRITKGKPLLLHFIVIVLLSAALSAPTFTMFGYPSNTTISLGSREIHDCQAIVLNDDVSSFRFFHCAWDDGPTHLFTARVYATSFAALYVACVLAVASTYSVVAYRSAIHRYMSTKSMIRPSNAEGSIASRLYDTWEGREKQTSISKQSSLASSHMKSMVSLMREMMVDEDRHGQKYLRSTAFPITWSQDSRLIDESAFMFSNLRTGYETDQEYYQIIMEDRITPHIQQEARVYTHATTPPSVLQKTPSPSPKPTPKSSKIAADSGPFRAIITPSTITDSDLVTVDFTSTEPVPSRRLSYPRATNLFHLAFSETEVDDQYHLWPRCTNGHQNGTATMSFSNASSRKAQKPVLLSPGGASIKENKYIDEQLEAIRSTGALDRTVDNTVHHTRIKSIAEMKPKNLTISLTDGICERLGLVNKSSEAVYSGRSSFSSDRAFNVMRWKQVIAKASKNLKNHRHSSDTGSSCDFKEDDKGSEIDEKTSERSSRPNSISASIPTPSYSCPESYLYTPTCTPQNKVPIPTLEAGTSQEPSTCQKEVDNKASVKSATPPPDKALTDHPQRRSVAPVNSATPSPNKALTDQPQRRSVAPVNSATPSPNKALTDQPQRRSVAPVNSATPSPNKALTDQPQRRSVAPVNGGTSHANKALTDQPPIKTVGSLGKAKKTSKSIGPTPPLSKNFIPAGSDAVRNEKVKRDLAPEGKSNPSGVQATSSSNFFELLRYHMSPATDRKTTSALHTLKERMSLKGTLPGVESSSPDSSSKNLWPHSRDPDHSRGLRGGRYSEKKYRHKRFRSYHQESRGIIPYPRIAIYSGLLLTCNILTYAPSVVFTLAHAFHLQIFDTVLSQRYMEVAFFVHDAISPVVMCLINFSFRNEIVDMLGLSLQNPGSRSTSSQDYPGSGESFL